MDRESLQRRCPRLGGDVKFSYCEFCGEEKTPCFKVLDCWWERFDVVAYMQANLTAEAFANLSASHRPPDKITSLVDLIRQAQARVGQD